MQDQDTAANGAGKTNGATHDAVASQAPVPAARPSAPTRSFERQAEPGSVSLDALRGGLGGQPGAKLQATTRVVNAFMGYLVNSCGRKPDELTDADMSTLGGILASLERLEVKRTGFPN